MTQEDKKLLGIDLCARAFSNLLCWVEGAEEPKKLVGFHVEDANNIIYKFEHNGLHNLEVYSSEVKPYLRPMSSMTKEEKTEWDAEYAYNSKTFGYEEYLSRMLDWLNKHHFDYRGLIEKGLALEAPDGMYK